jgi:choline dehydrogenase
MGNTEWSYAKVLPAFRAVETDLGFGESSLHGSTGPIRVQRSSAADLLPVADAYVAAATDAGFPWDPDMNGLSTGGVGLTPRNLVNGFRQNAGAAFVSQIIERPNLCLIDGAEVTRLWLDGSTARGVEASHRSELRRFEGAEVVLSASGLNSPHLLMVSGIGPADDLRALGIDVVLDQPGVGTNLSDHLAVNLRCSLAEAIETTWRPESLALNFSSEPGSSPEDLRIMLVLPKRPQAATALDTFVLHCELGTPDSRGRLRLRSATARVPPAVEFGYLSEESDRRRVRQCVRRAASLLTHSAYRRLGADPLQIAADHLRDDRALDAWTARNLATAYHSSGTCKMGTDDDATAVVDQYCRVRGISGLRVADISILPALPTRGTHATAVMLGHHAAGLIRRSPAA